MVQSWGHRKSQLYHVIQREERPKNLHRHAVRPPSKPSPKWEGFWPVLNLAIHLFTLSAAEGSDKWVGWLGNWLLDVIARHKINAVKFCNAAIYQFYAVDLQTERLLRHKTLLHRFYFSQWRYRKNNHTASCWTCFSISHGLAPD